MGKIRIKALGSAEEEAKQKEKAKARKETKRLTKTPGLKGGEKLVAMGPSEEELAATPLPSPVEEVKEATPQKKEKAKVKRKAKSKSKNYQSAAKLVKKNFLYPPKEAVDLIKKTSFSRFDGSIEVHINTLEGKLAGNVKLPHGTGREIKVAIANDKIISDIEAGKINFDVLLAKPEMMPKLAKVAKVLGPRGLMPNPKAGTISEDPEKVAEKFKSGEIRFKTEAQFPIIHLTIGKVSFPEKNLEENLRALITAVGPSKIKNVALSATMGPGVKVDISSFS